MCILLLLDGVVSRYQLFVLIDDAVEFNYILTDFLLAVSLHFWKSASKVSNSNNESSLSSCSSFLFGLMCFWGIHVYASTCVCSLGIYILGITIRELALLSYYNAPFLSLIIFLTLNSTLSESKITTPTFFDYCYPGIFLHPFIVDLHVYLYFKCVSYK